MAPSVAAVLDAAAIAVRRQGGRLARFGAGVSRRDQLLAALLLPFFVVAVMALAVVLRDVMIGLLPDALGGVGFVVFLLGLTLAIGTMVTVVVWVRSGGFGIFA